MMKKVNYKPSPETSVFCNKCRAKLVTPGDQKKALEVFGIIPNKCVPSEYGKSLCPYSK